MPANVHQVRVISRVGAPAPVVAQPPVPQDEESEGGDQGSEGGDQGSEGGDQGNQEGKDYKKNRLVEHSISGFFLFSTIRRFAFSSLQIYLTLFSRVFPGDSSDSDNEEPRTIWGLTKAGKPCKRCQSNKGYCPAHEDQGNGSD